MSATLAEVMQSIKNDIHRHLKEIWIAEAKIEALNEALFKLEGVEA